jgi:urate oxidase
MGIRIGRNNYGKSRVRLLRVVRGPHGNDIHEITVAIRFEGDFETVHTQGDNSKVLPTDTMKNTVYALAQREPVGTAELFAGRLIKHFLDTCPEVTRAEVDVREDLWARIDSRGNPHTTAFVRAGEEKRTASLSGTREGTKIWAGLENLIVMKTAQSAFEGFRKDRFTTLREDRNRILATSIKADWLYNDGEIDFNKVWDGVRRTLIENFAGHDSLSLQHTLYAMGEGVLSSFDQIREIRLSLPNKHYNYVNLSHFDLENKSEVFLPTDEPHGLIEATVERD